LLVSQSLTFNLQARRRRNRRLAQSSKETIMIKWLFRISVSIGLAGMVFGMAMGIAQNFTLAPAHAHFLLLGYVAMFLSALYYRMVPEAATSSLAPVQAVISVVGAILFPIGIACVRLGDRGRFMPVLVGGWLSVFTGMLLFAVIVYRSSGRVPARATTESDTQSNRVPGNSIVRQVASVDRRG
jgi:hypothetical protein